MDPDAPPPYLDALLRWYVDGGVDETIGLEPVDRYQQPAAIDTTPVSPPALDASPAQTRPAQTRPAHATPAEVARAHPSPATPAAPAPPAAARAEADTAGSAAAVGAAARLAAEAPDLDALKRLLDGFDGCALKRTATNLVFGDGGAHARVVLIGEAPGAEEDRQGRPFVGPSGRLLDRMLMSIGLDRGQVFISNTVFWRPPGNRSPTPQETATCMPFVARMIELIEPELLVALGGPAAGALLGQKESVGRLRGRWFSYVTPHLARPIPATAVFHPAYLLRSPAQKRLAWRDLLAIQKRLADPLRHEA
jgi:uracil-DNA glycosylase